MEPQLLITADQSHTLYHPLLDETYHSKGGAIGESQYVYIESGLAFIAQQKETVKILEFGFGTGLNALLSWMYAMQSGKNLWYDSVEKFPLPEHVYAQLNYGKQLNEQEKFQQVHTVPWNEHILLHPQFVFQKLDGDIFDFAFPAAYYDLVYFDAFAPSKQSEVWSVALLEKMYHTLVPGGALITYCSQGQFKRNLKSVGFELEMLPGPFKKKEITRAIKNEANTKA